jgi:hypothetical protein
MRKAASELVRVCRPGGTIGFITFTPEGRGGDFFRTLGAFAPAPPAGSASPLEWGSESHVRDLLGASVDVQTADRREYVETASSPTAYRDLFTTLFGPMIAIHAGLADQPERAAALDRAFLDFVERSHRGPRGGAVQIPYEYLLIVARTKG